MSALDCLTDLERACVRMAADGHIDKVIAATLGTTRSGVSDALKRARRRLQARNTRHLIATFIRHELGQQ